MKITIWSDFQCPFCYIGETMLEKVLGNMELTEPVEIEYRSYQLDPDAPAKPRETMTQHFMGDHEMTLQQAQARMAEITERAASVGLSYNLPEVKVCNTMDAHRLMKYAAERLSPGRLKRLNFSLFKSTFEDDLLLSSHELLADLGEKAGLERDAVLEMLRGDAYTEAVRADEQEIDSRTDFEYVPYMLFSNGSVIQGVLSEEELRAHLTSAMQAGTAPTTVTREGCGPNGCAL